MLKNCGFLAKRFASSSDSPRKLVLSANGFIAAWHPQQEFPFEHSKKIDLEELKKKESTRLSAAVKEASVPREPVNAELKDIFYTTKHEWYSRTREERLRHVSAPIPRRK